MQYYLETWYGKILGFPSGLESDGTFIDDDACNLYGFEQDEVDNSSLFKNRYWAEKAKKRIDSNLKVCRYKLK